MKLSDLILELAGHLSRRGDLEVAASGTEILEVADYDNLSEPLVLIRDDNPKGQ